MFAANASLHAEFSRLFRLTLTGIIGRFRECGVVGGTQAQFVELEGLTVAIRVGINGFGRIGRLTFRNLV